MYTFYISCLICSRFIRTAFSLFLETMTVLSLSVSVCIEVINQKLRQHQYHCYAVLPYDLLAVFRDKYLNSCNRQKWWYYYKMGDEFNRAKYTNQIWNCISSILYHYRQTSLTKKIKQCIQYNRRVASFTYSKMNYLNSKTSLSFLLNALTDQMLAKIIRNDAEAWLYDAGYYKAYLAHISIDNDLRFTFLLWAKRRETVRLSEVIFKLFWLRRWLLWYWTA